MSTNQQHEERDHEMKEKFVFFSVFAIVVLFGMIALQGCAPAAGVSLDGTSWTVTEINGEALLDSTQVTMDFTADEVNGNASCNSYFGSYTLQGESLTFDMIAQTEMWCMDEGVMDQETLFLQSLPKTETISIDGNQMTITLNDGGSLLLVEK